MGGLALALPLVAPSAAHAQLGPSPQTLFYTVQQNSPVPPPADGENWWVKAVLTEVDGGVKFDFESNFSQAGNFANDFVFSLNKALANISVSCTPGTGTACLDQKPGGTQADLFEYDPSGQGNFVGSKGWEFALLTPPPNGNLPTPPVFPPPQR